MTDRWLVVFTDLEPLPAGAPRGARLLHWALNRTLKPGFRHVFAVRPLPGGYLVANPHSAGLDIIALAGAETLPDSDYTADDWWRGLQLTIESRRLAAVWAPVTRPGPLRPRLLLTCVGAIKHLLGLSGWAVTPHQLYHHLTKET